MRDYKYAELFEKSNIDKQIVVEIEGMSTDITNKQIVYESLKFTDSICSQSQFTLGACETSSVYFKIANVFESLFGKKITVKIYLDGKKAYPLVLGVFKVQSDKPTADRIFREITAYDAMYDIKNFDSEKVLEWYTGLNKRMRLDELRNEFFKLVGVEQEYTTLINDSAVMHPSQDITSLSATEFVESLCLANGCFGHIRNGKFAYITLKSMDDEANVHTIEKKDWSNCTYEDYTVKKITGVKLTSTRFEDTYTWGTGTNQYYIENNTLIDDVAEEIDLVTIGMTVYNFIKEISEFQPCTIAARGNPCIEVGDAICVESKYKTIKTYIMERTLTGIQGMMDSYETKTDELIKEPSGTKSDVKKLWQRSEELEKDAATKDIILYSVTNDLTLTLNQNETTIAEFNIASVRVCAPIIFCTFPFTMNLDGNITIRYYFDNVLSEKDTLTQYANRGENLLSFNYVFDMAKDLRIRVKITAQATYTESDLRQNIAKIISFENFAKTGKYTEQPIDTTPPSGNIPRYGVKAVIFAQGMAGKDVWNGEIVLTDVFDSISIGGISVDALSDKVLVSPLKPNSNNISEVFGEFSIGDIAFESSFVEDIFHREYIVGTWNNTKAYTWKQISDAEYTWEKLREFDKL